VFAQLVLYLYNKTKARQLNGSHISMPRASWALLTDKEETNSAGVLDTFTANCGRPALFAHLPGTKHFNSLKSELNPICHLLALLGAHPIFHVSRIRVKHTNVRTLQHFPFLKVDC
jgi:hypothetical protein